MSDVWLHFGGEPEISLLLLHVNLIYRLKACVSEGRILLESQRLDRKVRLTWTEFVD
jgi:hypothetical protein